MSEELVVKKGVVVGLAYTLYVDEKIEDQSIEGEPLEYLHGYGNLISGLERQLEGLKLGEKIHATVQPEEGYGEYDEEGIIPLDRDLFPEDFPIEPGRALQLLDENNIPHVGYILDATESTVRVNMNHPLAGKVLIFDCEIMSLRPGTESELAQGAPYREDSGCCSDCGSCSHHCH